VAESSSPPPNPQSTSAPRVGGPHAETLQANEQRVETDVPTAALPALGAAPLSLVGKTFGDFELLAEIGRGGMGVVFKARQISLERTVALKMLIGEHLLDAARLARFVTEARTIAGLDHPNIVHVYQIGQCEFGHFFAMEYLDGQTLEAVVKAKHPVPLNWAATIMTKVGEAIQHAHSKGVIHRDLKPANIIIDRRRPVVMDFGIAKYLGKTSALTLQGAIMGTPAFMAPEQAGEDLVPVGPHSDIYSLGAILYMMVTGVPPYDGPTPLSTILKVLEPTPPAPLRDLRPDAPAELERIIMKCLAKRPADRFPNAGVLVEELCRFRATWKTTRKVPAASPQLLRVVLKVEATGKNVRLRKPITLVGRAPECTLLVRASDVSKHHCQIIIDTDKVVVEDLQSANGTYVNGKQVKKAQLHDGDELRIADHAFGVRIGEEES
jgi:serine/threonine protein kinase